MTKPVNIFMFKLLFVLDQIKTQFIWKEKCTVLYSKAFIYSVDFGNRVIAPFWVTSSLRAVIAIMSLLACATTKQHWWTAMTTMMSVIDFTLHNILPRENRQYNNMNISSFPDFPLVTLDAKVIHNVYFLWNLNCCPVLGDHHSKIISICATW